MNDLKEKAPISLVAKIVAIIAGAIIVVVLLFFTVASEEFRAMWTAIAIETLGSALGGIIGLIFLLILLLLCVIAPYLWENYKAAQLLKKERKRQEETRQLLARRRAGKTVRSRLKS